MPFTAHHSPSPSPPSTPTAFGMWNEALAHVFAFKGATYQHFGFFNAVQGNK